ncbi:MAG: DinB family protein [Bacteroidetes bacterium]|nr:MAG: DinB family protein [Bacteroidota bacterium]
MTPFKIPVSTLVRQLQLLLSQLNDADFTTVNPLLSGATLGQHFRHVIELFSVLSHGYASGIINYDERARNGLIETNRTYAYECLSQIEEMLFFPNKPLCLVMNDLEPDGQPLLLETNFFRELGYNLEHAVHHMAIIKMALLNHPNVVMAPEFGVANSTLKYRNACVQ